MDAKTTVTLAVAVTIDGAAKMLGTDRRSVERMILEGQIAATRAGGVRILIPMSEITRLTSSPPAAPAPPTERYPSFSAPEETSAFILEHVPAAEPWWHLWRADLSAMFFAREIANTLQAPRGDRLLLEHSTAERSSSLGYLAELILADQRAKRALGAHDVRPSITAEIQAKRARLAELISEVQLATEPKPTTEPKP